jgi:hypothetical protein
MLLLVLTAWHGAADAQQLAPSTGGSAPAATPGPQGPGPQISGPQAPNSQGPDLPAPPAAADDHKPGLLDALNEWAKKSAADFDANMKKMRDSIDAFNARADKAAKEAATATKDATDALVKFPAARVVEGRERCVVSPNGAPDCQAAAIAMCKAKGFATGNSVDMQSAQKCPARVWLSGRMPAEGECTVETFVTRAACQ